MYPEVIKAVCPICYLPPQHCTFFARMKQSMFHPTEKKSAKLRSEAFRKFHADICEHCHRDVRVCKEKKMASMKAYVRKRNREIAMSNRHSPGMLRNMIDEDTFVAEKKADWPCRRPTVKGRTSVPDWYTEE